MAEGYEVARAVVTLIPSMKGSQETITSELTGTAKTAGTSVGKTMGTSMVSSIGSTMSSAGSTMTKNLTVPIAAIGVASVAAFNEVDDGLDIIRTKTGATGEQLNAMKDSMENLATSIPVSFEEAGSAIGEVNTRFDLTGDALEELSGQFLKFAKINDTDVSTSIDNVSKVINAFGMDASDAGDVLDMLNQVGQQTGVSVDTLSTSLSQNAAQLTEMGLSASDAAAFLGSCDKAGLEISTTMMGLKTAMKNAASDGKDLDEFLSDFSKTMSSNASESEKLTAAYETFGSRAGAAIYNAVKNGKIDLEDLTGSLGDFAGSVDATYDEIIDPTDELVEIMNELKLMLADLAEAAMPIVKDVLDAVLPVIKDLAEGWESLSPGMQEFIVKAGLVVAAAGPILSLGGSMMSTVSTIKSAFSSLTGTMSNASAQFGGFTGLMSTNVSDLTSTMSGKLGTAGAVVGTFMAAFSITDWLLELTGAKEKLEQFGSDIYDFFHKAENASVDLTNQAMAAFEAYAMRGEGTFEEVMQQLTEAQEAASAANTAITRQDAETLQKYIDLMENGVAETRAKEAQARQAANDSMIAENEMVSESLQATMDAANAYIEEGVGNAEEIMQALMIAYGEYSDQNDAKSQETAANIQAMMEQLTLAMDTTSESLSQTAEAAAANLQQAMSDANAFLETGKGDTEAILTNLRSAYEYYSNRTDESSQAVAASVDEMVNAIEAASGISIDATGNMQDNTVADLATISRAMSDLGITDVGQFVTAIETGVSSVDASFADMQESITSNMSTASSAVDKAIGEIEKRFANANLNFQQNIALPHFSMYGSFDAETGEVPTVSVSWYRRAAEEGAIFADPTLIGVGDAAQPEMLIGERTLYEQIAKAVAESNGGGDIIIPIYIGDEHIEDVVIKAQQMHNYKSGGRS